ncbi:protein HUA2-LIKE 2 [Iris pallida]|uniref:Protein HUA2-LIKE 2 n=1 Tax=Iris pallida TaxID=29817 RepID=A0AAX6DZB1_IRIPA|nr:protein HUA2-LIKE 2 [Iris pallida]
MAPSRRRGSQRAAAARRQWNVGDLVLAKMKGFPAWPAVVTEPEKWGYSSSDRKKLLVYFYGTKQIAFCNYADIEAFTEEKKKSLLIKRQGKGSDFVRAIEEIIDIYETTKKQSLVEANSREGGMEPNLTSSEGSRSKSLRKSPEISSLVTNNNQSEALNISTENHDVIADETPVVSVDRENTRVISSDPTEKVSILDQLRQTSLSATTTRKRLRDGSMQISVVQRVPSLRRSRSSSGGDSSKLQKSTMTLSDVDLSSKDSVRDLMEEEPADENKLAEVVAHVSECCNGVTDASDGLTINGCSRDDVSDIAAVTSEKEGEVEISSRLENPIGPSLNENLVLNGGGRLNGKLVPPTKSVIVKKRRGSHRKRVTTTRESDAPHKAAVSIELHEIRSESPTSHKETNEKFSKTDGDEHLPLVKRARVRMGKPSVEEKQLEDFVGDREKTEIGATVVNLGKCPTSSSPVNGSTGRTARVEEVTSSVPTNGCTLSEEIDPVHWKVNKYQVKGITVDVEAALPPSKRLHRALEAMSANAAEATVDTPEVAGGMELASNGCTELPKSNSVHFLAAENILTSARSPRIQSCDKTNLQNNASGWPSSLTSDNLAVSMLTSSLVEHDDALPKSFSPRDKDCKEILAGGRDCNGSITSEIADADIHEKVLQPCTFKLIEKEMSSTSTESLHCQLSSPLGGEDGNKTLKPAKEPFFPRGDIVGENGMVDPLMRKSDSILNSKEDGNLLPTDETAVASSGGNAGPVASKSLESTKSPGSLSDESIQSKDMQDVVKQAKHKAAMKYWEISSDIAPMKDLIAAAQAKRLLSRSTSFPDSFADGKVGLDDAVSPSVVNKEDSSVRGSPPIPRMYHRPTSDDRTHQLHNGNRSPSVGQRHKGLNKLTVHGEANVARRSFEALLCTLSRTKESIGRATRVAIDCIKYGIAAEAIEILLQYLERESSMHKKIDLFFLVDSITQWSRSQKGGAGDVYLSLVQSILPRLLSAAAPPGHGAWENRKQCLKASIETLA